MFILGCDSSSIASGALLHVDDDAALGEPFTGEVEVAGRFQTEDTRSHAEAMAPGIQAILDEAGISGPDLGMILAGVGPGPFTGLRAGIATARTMAWAWSVPLRGVMSLDAIAEGVWRDAARSGLEVFQVATDARRREVYSATYRLRTNAPQAPQSSGYDRMSGPAVGPATDLEPGLVTAGRGAALYSDALTPLPGHLDDEPWAEWLVRAALRQGLATASESTSPLYLRESDARVPTGRKRATR
ncbi:tRNA (adenosine(37)-N6)-threonylcarbamoyltransferase complex dimerization subunit type 1 TsaB [Kocuria massiliensis]|uniref:tRNA (adenosine(37)-N6)-threonylcarbamoyltransferase complex dimerization subunit type 1 TsaB n=1 Tax=Kocuria massiliensis TaxID=1926282 RepID=UPI000A1CD97E|nr:tRNA (adenosine(37)-N6)-threonylcarbamoyltransferase complex dimerization subunit type 1 TsaB [Kocuria massiliensis]